MNIQKCRWLACERFLIALLLLTLGSSTSTAATLLLNGAFEDTSKTTLANGDIQFTGWTAVLTNSGFSDFFLEGTAHSSVSSTAGNTKFDGTSPGTAVDPFSPYTSSSDEQLDYYGYVRPSYAAQPTSYAELFSNVFKIDGDIQFDVFREDGDSNSSAFLFRASDDFLLNSLTITTDPQQWHRQTLSTSGFTGTEAYLVLHGGTNQGGSGYLTLYDNVFGGLTVVIPEPGTYTLLLLGAAVVIAGRRRRKPAA